MCQCRHSDQGAPEPGIPDTHWRWSPPCCFSLRPWSCLFSGEWSRYQSQLLEKFFSKLSNATLYFTITNGADVFLYVMSFVPRCITTWSGFSSFLLLFIALVINSSTSAIDAPDLFGIMNPGFSMLCKRESPIIIVWHWMSNSSIVCGVEGPAEFAGVPFIFLLVDGVASLVTLTLMLFSPMLLVSLLSLSPSDFVSCFMLFSCSLLSVVGVGSRSVVSFSKSVASRPSAISWR